MIQTLTKQKKNREDKKNRLLSAVKAFALAHNKRPGWANDRYEDLKLAKITTLDQFAALCRQEQKCADGDTKNDKSVLLPINFELKHHGGVPRKRHFATSTIQDLCAFLPGPINTSCWKLAVEAGDRAKLAKKKGVRVNPITEYVHRDADEDEEENDEIWQVGKELEQWTMHVDCAGFVRRVLRSNMVDNEPFTGSLSDRDFMRAKDFFAFFDSLSSSGATGDNKGWRRVDDLRQIIAGDIIVYCGRGNAAGGCVFTVGDRKNLPKLLESVAMAILYKKEKTNGKAVVTTNMARHESVAPFVAGALTAFQSVFPEMGVKELREKLEEDGGLESVASALKDYYDKRTDSDSNSKSADGLVGLQSDGSDLVLEANMDMLKEAAMTIHKNTGHIVFATGPPKYFSADGDWRVPLVQSTGASSKYHGVQHGYKRFLEDANKGRWIKEDKKKQIEETGTGGEEMDTANNAKSDSDDDNYDFEDDDVDGETIVLAARMLD